MKSITVRGIDEETLKALREEARQTGKSINATILQRLKEAMGLIKKKRTRIYYDLDELAGTWSAEDELQFRRNTQYFDKIDKEIWD